MEDTSSDLCIWFIFFSSSLGGKKDKKGGGGGGEEKAFAFTVNPFLGFAFLPRSRRLAQAKREVRSAFARAVDCRDHVVSPWVLWEPCLSRAMWRWAGAYPGTGGQEKPGSHNSHAVNSPH